MGGDSHLFDEALEGWDRGVGATSLFGIREKVVDLLVVKVVVEDSADTMNIKPNGLAEALRVQVLPSELGVGEGSDRFKLLVNKGGSIGVVAPDQRETLCVPAKVLSHVRARGGGVEQRC